MQWLRAGIHFLLVGVCLVSAAPAANAAPASDEKQAHKAFNRGLKLQESQNLEAALPEFEEAFRLSPSNTEYLAAREMTRQNLAGTHLDRGNTDLASGRQAEALAEFRTALALDPQNEFAQQRVRDALGPDPVPRLGPAQVVESADQITAKPIDAPHDFHYRGDSRGLFTAVASSYGLTVLFDDSFPSRTVRFDLAGADFATAIQAASSITKTFVVPLEDTVLFVAPDTQENHRMYDRMGMRSYYFPGVDPAKELNELMNSLRTLFEFRFVALSAAANTITIRGPIGMLEAATKFLAQLDVPRPELLLDVQVFEVDYTYTKNIGLHVPDQFKLYNIPAAALAALGGQNLQDLINQLIASGGINQAGNSSIAALIAQLQSQQNSIFSQPLATFGGGLTFFGLSLDQLAAVLSLNESSVRSLQHVTLRASQEKEATFKLGSRYPVLNASFSPISNSAAIAGVLQNQTYTAPFPSVNYEDLGLTLKAKPLIHNNFDVDLTLSLQFRALGGTNVNGVPIITNREFTGGILLKNGEPAVIAGMVNTVDQRSLNGLPLFSRIPGFGALTSQRSTQKTDDELLILVTPHVVGEPQQSEAQEIWLNK
jgi:general secretion pathway protein D